MGKKWLGTDVCDGMKNIAKLYGIPYNGTEETANALKLFHPSWL